MFKEAEGNLKCSLLIAEKTDKVKVQITDGCTKD
jgi:hypothetical protein